MIELRFGPWTLAQLRFSPSPLTEAIRSLRVLDDPRPDGVHADWVRGAREAVRDLDLDPLRALLRPVDAYMPDFISPPPGGPSVDLEDELKTMLAVPPSQVRREVRAAFGADRVPPALAPLIDRPAHGLPQLAELVRAYWGRALAPHWPRLRATLNGDVTYRAHKLAEGGAALLFADIDPCVEWRGDRLTLDKVFEGSLQLDARGLLLIPSVFVWPRVVVILDPAWQPAIVYPARGAAAWGHREDDGTPDAVARLLGHRRAAVLTAIDQPVSTTDLAQSLGASPGGTSQHLTVLRRAGLVQAHRAGRAVLYHRTALGDDLLAGGARSR